MECSSSSKKATVLVVDDDRDAREAMTELLEIEGFTVLAAANGREALDVLKVENPSVVLLDLMMPVISGWEFLRRRKNKPKLAKIPVIVTSAVIDRAAASDAEGVDEFLVKPINIDKLLTLVKRFSAQV